MAALALFRNIGRGTMTITVEVPIEQGELIAQAIDKAAEQSVATGPEDASESWRAQQADALVSIAMCHLNGAADSGGTCADNYQVLIHVDESALTGGGVRFTPGNVFGSLPRHTVIRTPVTQQALSTKGSRPEFQPKRSSIAS